MIFEHDEASENYNSVKIKVVGVGGGGNNAVNRMITSNIAGVEFVSVNTDRQALRKSEAPNQLVIGEKITKGFGAGANPQVGARAAEESIDDIRAILEDTQMVFITAGMGGGTGTGAAPVVARVARELDILTVGVVTKPFVFEGKRRADQAEAGIAELAQYVDALIVIPNERLNQVSNQKISLGNAFQLADDVLRRGVQGVSDLIVKPAFVNLDFADITSVMKDAGFCHMGIGVATGKDKAVDAARAAISSPLLETSIRGAKGVLVSVAVGPDVSLDDVTLTSTLIQQEADPSANIIWGCTIDDDMEDEIRVTLIATGFEKKPEDEQKPNPTESVKTPNPAIKQIPTNSYAQGAPKQEAKPQPTAPATRTEEKQTITVKKVPSQQSFNNYDDVFGMMKNNPKK